VAWRLIKSFRAFSFSTQQGKFKMQHDEIMQLDQCGYWTIIVPIENNDLSNRCHKVVEKYDGEWTNDPYHYPDDDYFSFVVPTTNAAACIDELKQAGATIRETHPVIGTREEIAE
jgi:hypothetical protein